MAGALPNTPLFRRRRSWCIKPVPWQEYTDYAFPYVNYGGCPLMSAVTNEWAARREKPGIDSTENTEAMIRAWDDIAFLATGGFND